jgi:hypothetical protein
VNYIPRILLVCFILFSVFAAPAFAIDWKELKSEHFIVYYLDGENFAGEVSRYAERYYTKIASDLGYARYDNFWTWDNRVKIYIFLTREDFLKETGAQEWSYGFTSYDKKSIVSFEKSERFLDALLPHEIAHLIFRDFVGFKGEVPIWLDEGVAQWEEADKRAASVELVKVLIAKKELIPLADLMRMDISRENNEIVTLKFYAEAASLVGFMIERYGASRFTEFCRQLRDGATMNKALAFTYSDTVRDTDILEKEWLKYYGG